ncbi:hypothetical protein EDB83DRAFT_2571256 [Lactarius deliciosus]|nr:hypothetical protein EDB83DRAFT_2571256 [Lactarius deliciosus]
MTRKPHMDNRLYLISFGNVCEYWLLASLVGDGMLDRKDSDQMVNIRLRRIRVWHKTRVRRTAYISVEATSNVERPTCTIIFRCPELLPRYQRNGGRIGPGTDKKKTEGWKVDADGILIFVPRTRSPVSHLSKLRPTSSIPFGKGATGFVAILLPLSATLPSPEARAHGSAAPRSPSLRAGTLGSPGPSTSDLGVRALKSLYTVPWQRYHVYQRQRQRCLRRAAQSGPGHTLRSPVVDGGGSGPGTFRVEAFALRVQALIADDRALMECLIRLAQAHDLLKKNVERAQKRATPRLRCTSARQGQVDQLAAEKLAVEEHVAEQTETLRQLTEANGVLSARALQLAEDAAAVQEELRTVNAVSERKQTQRLALLEEINLVQTENGGLCQQLRALGKL